MSLPFLLEIGTEEIPDWMIDSALADLKRLFTELLHESKLGGEVTRVDATPRRLVLWAHNIQERQADTEEVVLGPPKASAYKDGKPTGAATGWAKKMGLAVEALKIESTPKGEYLACVRRSTGRPSDQILADALPGLIGRIYFPKTMYWTGKGGARFIRPIRWIVALLGKAVVPFTFADVTSGQTTYGHRQLGQGKALAVTIDNYEDEILGAGVILSAETRRGKIAAELEAHLRGSNYALKADPKLLHTLAYLTEHPTVIKGGFDPAFLALPKEVLVMVMRHHQRYFGVLQVDPDKQPADYDLAPQFLAVTNIDGDPNGLIQRGNEHVLKARFKDAQFFYQTDRQRTLESRVEDLNNVTFQAKLGSYKQKTERIVALAAQIAAAAHANMREVERAALLCKCDLVTEMVKEFTDLQGIVGGLYAKAEGEPAEVWEAIYDHYKPLSMEDSIPHTLAGRVLALADKLDTLKGCFSVGMIPSGSKDPFALRRSTQGVVKILVEGELPIPLSTLIGEDRQLRDFFLDRLKYYFKDICGFAYDEVNAVLAAGHDNLPDAHQRLLAIRAVRPTENFEPLAASFKRIQNILQQAAFTQASPIDAALLEPGPEQDLHAAFEHAREHLAHHRKVRDYVAALQTIASLRPKVDHFFDKVLVNAPDPAVRQNRLSLLSTLLAESSTIADFSEIVTASKEQ